MIIISFYYSLFSYLFVVSFKTWLKFYFNWLCYFNHVIKENLVAIVPEVGGIGILVTLNIN